MTGARPDTWMPFYVGDYLRDTGHLSPAEHGAYLLLIFHYWTSGGPLVNDDSQLRRVCRMTAREWDVSRETLARFFIVTDEFWQHNRIDSELERANRNIEKRSKAGSKGAAKRWQTDGNAIPVPLANGYQNDGPSPSPSPRKKEEESPPVDARSRVTLGRDFAPDPESLQFAALKCIQDTELTECTETFVNKHLASGETRADWQAEFRKFAGYWARNRHRDRPLNGHTPRQANAPPSFAKAAMEVVKRARERGE